MNAWYDGSYGALNDPTVAGGLPNKQGMVLYSVTTNEVDFLTITLAQDKTFVMGVMGGSGGSCPVVLATRLNAVSFRSRRLLDRIGMV